MKDYKTAKIYKIVNSVNDTIYIGSTCAKLSERMRGHRSACKNPKSQFYKNAREIGVEHFRMILIKEFPCDNYEQLLREEYDVMKRMKEQGIELYNDFIGEMSKEQKKKLSEAKKGKYTGNKHPMFGKHHSEKSRQKISQAQKGKIVSESTKQKMSESHNGEKNHLFSYGSIYFDKNGNRWVFKWRENKKEKRKYFSVKKYGEWAKLHAEEYRKKIYPESVDESQYVEIIFLD
jgi:group I intron endonuclease